MVVDRNDAYPAVPDVMIVIEGLAVAAMVDTYKARAWLCLGEENGSIVISSLLVLAPGGR